MAYHPKTVQLRSKYKMVRINKTSDSLRKWFVIGDDVKQNKDQYIALGKTICLTLLLTAMSLKVNDKSAILQKGCYYLS